MSLVVCKAWDLDLILCSNSAMCYYMILDSPFFWGGVMPQVLHLYNGTNSFAELIVGLTDFWDC